MKAEPGDGYDRRFALLDHVLPSGWYDLDRLEMSLARKITNRQRKGYD